MHCLDSDFLIDVLRRDSSAVKLLREIEGRGRPAVSAVTAYEVTDTPVQRVREAALASLETLEVVPVDGSIATAASRLSADLRARGQGLPMADLLIASTCLLGKRTLVTRNARHFGRVRGLRLRGW